MSHPIRLGARYRQMRDAFRAAGLATPELDARLLISGCLGLEPKALLLDEDRVLDAAELEQLDGRQNARLEGIPVGRILGRREFWGIELSLSKDTLEPRPDTEILVEAVLDWLGREGRLSDPLRFLDIGTGSGAILIALLSELPAANGVGSDLSEGALKQASTNLERAGLSDRAHLVCGSYTAPFAGPFDFIVSNPPYIRSADLAILATEVRDHDPVLALDGGPDGLLAYRQICPDLDKKVTAGGRLFVEIGSDQGEAVSALFTSADMKNVNVIRDLSGKDRVISATLSHLSV